jgi:hypothetical protein
MRYIAHMYPLNSRSRKGESLCTSLSPLPSGSVSAIAWHATLRLLSLHKWIGNNPISLAQSKVPHPLAKPRKSSGPVPGNREAAEREREAARAPLAPASRRHGGRSEQQAVAAPVRRGGCSRRRRGTHGGEAVVRVEERRARAAWSYLIPCRREIEILLCGEDVMPHES